MIDKLFNTPLIDGKTRGAEIREDGSGRKRPLAARFAPVPGCIDVSDDANESLGEGPGITRGGGSRLGKRSPPVLRDLPS